MEDGNHKNSQSTAARQISELSADLDQGFELGEWLAEPLKGTLTRDNMVTHVEPKVMDVLVCLAASPGEVVRRDELFESVWGDVVVSEEVLTRCISELRSALGDNKKTRVYIQTLPKRGYRLLKSVRALSQEADTGDASNGISASNERAAVHWTVPIGIVFCLALIFPILMALQSDSKLDTTLFDNKSGSDTVSIATANDNGSSPLPAGPKTVAVLPLVNLSGDQETDYFANGLTADIRNTLIRVASNELRVVARTSSEAFKGQATDIRSIGRQLDASEIVEGTVRINNDRVRVTAQLTNTNDGFPIWAERFEYDLKDGLLIQSDIADRIVEQLMPAAIANVGAPDRQTNLKAYDYYLLGRHHWNKRTPESLELADSYFRQALALDTDYALALSGLADALILKEEYGGANPADAVDLAQQMVKRALALQPDLAEVHASAGAIASHMGDAVEAETYYRKAVQLKPSYSMGRMWLGNLLLRKNAVNEAFEHFSSAIQVDPLNAVVQQNYLRSLTLMGRYDEAAERAEAYLADGQSDHFLKTWMFAMLDSGRYDELLSFAVRHTFSDEYADYGSQIVMEALIYLQRFDEAKKLYEQLALNMSGVKRSWFLATLGTALRDTDKLVMAADLMASDSSKENPHHECQSNYVNFWRGIAAHIEGDYPAAALMTGKALSENIAACLNHPVRKAEIMAYHIDSLNRSGQITLANELAEQGIAELQQAVDQGRNGLDVEFGLLSLNVSAGRLDKAQQKLQKMQDKGWQYYAKLAHMPLFDAHYDELHKNIGENAQQFAMMQSECKDIRMTKFGL
ncbi:MAG: winged helix-turn-helix domain-containing protein [Pseudomonadales bacterium]